MAEPRAQDSNSAQFRLRKPIVMRLEDGACASVDGAVQESRDAGRAGRDGQSEREAISPLAVPAISPSTGRCHPKVRLNIEAGIRTRRCRTRDAANPRTGSP